MVFSDLKVVNIFLSFEIILYKSEIFKFCEKCGDIEWNLVESRLLNTVAFIAGKKNPATQIFFIRFSIKIKLKNDFKGEIASKIQFNAYRLMFAI